MKLGVLTTSYPRTPDDPAGHFVRSSCEWLAEHVGDVEVLACADGGDMGRGGLPVELAGARGLPRALSITARLLTASLRHHHRWDAILSHWLVPCGAVGLLCARGRRHLAIAHGSDVQLLRARPGGPALVRRLARSAELIYVSESLRIPGAPGRVVAMTAPAAASRTDEERAEARAALGLSPVGQGPLVALFLGRLVHDKGADRLLDAASPEVLALVAGEGPERERLVRHPAIALGHARLLGPCVGVEKRRLLCAADVLVVPSRRDGAPTVVAEARQIGLPIVASAVGGLPEVVGSSGWLVQHHAAALTDELRRLAHHRSAMIRHVQPPPSWAEVGAELWGGPLRERGSSPGNIKVIRY